MTAGASAADGWATGPPDAPCVAAPVFATRDPPRLEPQADGLPPAMLVFPV